MSKRRKRAQSKSFNLQSLPKQLQHINLNAAGIDIGSERHMVAVPEGRAEVAVRGFCAFTGDLVSLADWLGQCGVTTVAMESTGGFLIPFVGILEPRGFERKVGDVTNGKDVKG